MKTSDELLGTFDALSATDTDVLADADDYFRYNYKVPRIDEHSL